MYKLDVPIQSEYPVLLEIWESSVRATHHFVIEEDISFFRKAIQEQQMFENSNLTVVRDEANTILGFMGVTDNNLDMIFIGGEYIGKGVGGMLMRHAINQLNVTKVDVNEENIDGLGFYQHFGFVVAARSEYDDMGKPYPLLHMQLHNSR